ncbi:DUF485 domain-containing protein [Streptomyces sp. NPDC050619]|uniref:DUF485 domain-containing protein n=1 Tax=Streptomyces sp. NPDC050619 TaxID=3157214 RepID=UPI0034168126
MNSRRISDDPEFRALRRTQRRFGTLATVLSVGAFLLYVLLSGFAPAMMSQPLFGHFTIGLALGLGQFVVMAVTVWRYLQHMRTEVDPRARRLRTQLHSETRPPRSAAPPPAAGRAPHQGSRGYRTW